MNTGSRRSARSAAPSSCSDSCSIRTFTWWCARPSSSNRSASSKSAARWATGRGAVFSGIALPLVRPAIVAGTTLALMETLADFGTVSYFAVPTFTTGIYRAWLSMGDRVAGGAVISALLGFVVLVLLLERWSRGRARYYNAAGRRRDARPQLSGIAALDRDDDMQRAAAAGFSAARGPVAADGGDRWRRAFRRPFRHADAQQLYACRRDARLPRSCSR